MSIQKEKMIFHVFFCMYVFVLHTTHTGETVNMYLEDVLMIRPVVMLPLMMMYPWILSMLTGSIDVPLDAVLIVFLHECLNWSER